MENPANMENAVYILRKKAKRKKRITILCGIISIAVFLCVWQLLCSLKIVSGDVLASPLQVIDAIITKIGDPRPDGNTLIENILSSFKLAMIGFFLALIVGLPLGLLMGWYRPLDKFIKPIFELIRPLPPIAWIPIVIVLLGIGTVAKSFIIFFTTFVPIVINSYTGIRETNQVYINYAKTCGYSNWRIFLTIGIPSAMPLSFAGMVIALGNGWGTLIAAEMLASSSGLGYMIFMGRNYGRIDIIIAGMLVIGLIGLGLTFGLSKIENYVLKWRINTK
ncbi:ABC transporter permease [Faecalicatena acetigenes]|uniref:ABC transporter permease n=1 Tax=Faecalicatena acetigenes TaxID=2981790 RepID=A0ABT2TCY6_9FIRM|nr:MULTISPECIES: ABC transporter permease [Lachnospiraceae]MCU6748097.1 ABC transporter permease [Faecalicatena acetigenes]SCI26176.1 Bicarbonate transport system permease protein CmpB [uncultured Clostridium sp.]